MDDELGLGRFDIPMIKHPLSLGVTSVDKKALESAKKEEEKMKRTNRLVTVMYRGCKVTTLHPEKFIEDEKNNQKHSTTL